MEFSILLLLNELKNFSLEKKIKPIFIYPHLSDAE